MKIFTLLFAIAFLSFAAYSQDATANSAEWVTLENENKEVSFSMPKDYLVNNTSDNSGKETDIIGFQNGVMMEVNFSREIDGKARIGRIRPQEYRKPIVNEFSKDNFAIKIISYTEGGYDSRIYLASKKYFYIIKVSSAIKDKSEVSRFLQSIRLNNQPIFADANAAVLPAGEVLILQKLKTSEQVLKALDIKSEKIDRKIKVEPLTAYVAETETKDGQKAILLTDIKPSSPPSFSGSSTKGGEMRIKIQLLASGQVGDITVYTNADSSFAKNFALGAKSLKFIPASQNGVPVDSFQTVTMWGGVVTSITMVNIR